jgi:hypothetical protein
MEMFGELESISNNSEIEWSMWKERWNNEKQAYINRNNELENLVKTMRKMKTNGSSSSPRKEHKEPYEVCSKSGHDSKVEDGADVKPLKRAQLKDISTQRFY